MKSVYKQEEKKEKNKRANAAILAALFFSLALIGGGAAIIISGFVVGDVAVVNVTVLARGAALSFTAVTINDVGIDLSNMTTQMTTLIITLISVFIPLMILMWYFGIFSDLFGMIGNMMRSAFKRN